MKLPECTNSRPIIAASFGRAAEGYRTQARIQQDMAEWLAEWLPPRRRGRVLETGAGPGLFTHHLFPWAGDVVATDLSTAMCIEGKRNVPFAQWRPMAAETPLEGPWDLFVSSSALQWIKDPPKVFKAWSSVAAPSGRMLLGIFVSGTLSEWLSLSGSAAPFCWRTVEEWRAAVQVAGWTLVRDTVSLRTYDYPSSRHLLRSLHDIGAAPFQMLSGSQLRSLLKKYDQVFLHSAGVRATWAFYRCEAVVTESR